MNSSKKKINECIGCGLCKTVFGDKVDLNIDSKGFIRPYFKDDYDKSLLQDICPIFNLSGSYSEDIWGNYVKVYLGTCLDENIRFKASSGGVLSQTLIYLLETNKVDGVIHIGASHDNPLENRVYLSNTKKQVLENSGSRYSPAAPLEKLGEYLKKSGKFAFVGKPCDIRALRNYQKINSLAQAKIPYVISFFCAGTPSHLATERVLDELRVTKGTLKKLTYRGNGWPGNTTAITNKDISYSMSYDDSWGKILGKDIQSYCRWCADGVGEFADLSFGDAWYLDKDNKPNFSENVGRNVIFARSNKGDELLKEMVLNRKIEIDSFVKDIEALKYMQKYQYERKATMLGKIIALKLLLKKAPKFNYKDLFKWSKNISLHKNIRVFIGTVKRGLRGRF